MFNIRTRDIAFAQRDIFGAFREWRICNMLAMQEIRQRYRRSTLGPLWLTVTMAIQVSVMGVLIGTLLAEPFEKYLPFLVIGFVIWNFWSLTVSEGSTTFIHAGAQILQARRSLNMYLLQGIWRNVIIMAHTAIVIVIVFIIFGVYPTPISLLAIPGLFVVLLNAWWLNLFFAIVATRFRDIPVILTSIMPILFWSAPIVYEPSQLGDFAWIPLLNPVTHMIDVVRAPLLGELPALSSWETMATMTAVGWGATFAFFARFHHRIAYWL